MKKENLVGLISGISVFFTPVFVLGFLGTGDKSDILSFPVNGIGAIAFVYGWGFGFSDEIAIALAIVTFFIPAVVAFFVGRKVASGTFQK